MKSTKQLPTKDGPAETLRSGDWLGIREGDELTFDVLTWQNEGYEFGRPCLMLAPVIRENSDSDPESLIESVCIDAVVDGRLVRNNEQQQIEWRGWNLAQKRRRFNEALAGKRFPVAGYRATRKRVKIVRDKHGDLSWVDLPNVKDEPRPGARSA